MLGIEAAPSKGVYGAGRADFSWFHQYSARGPLCPALGRQVRLFNWQIKCKSTLRESVLVLMSTPIKNEMRNGGTL